VADDYAEVLSFYVRGRDETFPMKIFYTDDDHREYVGDFDRFLARVRADTLRTAADEIRLDLGPRYSGADDLHATGVAEAWLEHRAARIEQETTR
jgi:hypothetical protein